MQYETRSFGIDVLVCPQCRGKRKLLTFLTNPRAIERILAHFGLPTELPAIAPARGPPEQELLFQG